MARTLVALVLTIALSPPGAHAQQEEGASGRLIGVVTDADTEEPLEGVLIRILGTKLRTRTDASGHYVIDGVPPGTFRVAADYSGYAMITFNNVNVGTAKDRELSVKLPSAARVHDERRTMTAVVPPQVASSRRASRILTESYPLRAREWQIGATVVVSVYVSAEGKVLDARIQQPSGYKEFDEAVLTAVRRFAWRPGRNAADEAIPAWTEVSIRFEGR